jgi:hypothetical protein
MQKKLLILSVFVSLSFLTVSPASCQKQLVLLKKQKVLLRLYPGDEFVFRLKGSRKIRKSYINNLYDTAVVAHHDVIPFHKIDRIYFVRRNLLNVTGGLLVVGGIGYFLIDQVNVVLVHGEKVNLDDNVSVASAIMVGAGLPMLLSKKKYARTWGKYRLLMADKGSVFYTPDARREIGEFD